MVSQLPHGVGKRIVVRGDGAALAGRDDLARMEAETAGDAEPAAGPAAVARAERAGSVLEQRQPRAARAAAAAARTGARRGAPSCAARRSICAGSMFIVSGSTSTSTGISPASATTFAVAGNVYAGTSTSSPGSRPNASTARWSAAVPEVTARACSTSHEPRELGLELGHLRAHREHAALEDLGHLGELRSPMSGQPRRMTESSLPWYHAIVFSRPSSSSTCGSHPSTSRAFFTFGMRSSTSA